MRAVENCLLSTGTSGQALKPSQREVYECSVDDERLDETKVGIKPLRGRGKCSQGSAWSACI